MKIYLDVILIINFAFDFLLLLSVNIILKRKSKWGRIILASLIASFSVFFLFLNINSFELFLLKLLVSVLMILISFGKNDFGKNFLYLYFISIILGGFLYFINLQVSYKNEGLLFFYNGFSVNIIVLLILSPIILIYYYKQSRYFKDTLSNVHNIDIYFNNTKKSYRAYLDTGNKLYEPYKNREVILLYDEALYEELESFLIIPFKTMSTASFLKGIVVEKIVIDDKFMFKNQVIGISKTSFNLDNSKVILHSNFKSHLT